MYKYRVAPEVYSGEYDYMSFYLYSYLYNVYSEELLLPQAAEIYRSSKHQDDNANRRFVVYDLELIEEFSSITDVTQNGFNQQAPGLTAK